MDSIRWSVWWKKYPKKDSRKHRSREVRTKDSFLIFWPSMLSFGCPSTTGFVQWTRQRVNGFDFDPLQIRISNWCFEFNNVWMWRATSYEVRQKRWQNMSHARNVWSVKGQNRWRADVQLMCSWCLRTELVIGAIAVPRELSIPVGIGANRKTFAMMSASRAVQTERRFLVSKCDEINQKVARTCLFDCSFL